MDLKKLIDFLPHQYKDRDTYKVGGKGILERFLEVCGTYLADVITPDIDNELDLIDIDNVPDIYLNYLWEFLGEIPFAYGVTIDKDKFNKYYNGLRTKEELKALSKVWTIPKSGPVVLSEEKVRSILRYAITLIKIRGTKKFFVTLFKLYGFDCTVSDPIETIGNVDSQDNLWFNHDTKYDIQGHRYDTGSTYDHYIGCNQCVTVNFDLSNVHGFADKTGEYFRDSLGILYCGKYDPLLDLYQGIENWNNQPILYSSEQDTWIAQNEQAIFSGQIPASVKEFNAFRKMVTAFFERYLPYNVKFTLTFQGKQIDDQASIIIEQLDSDKTATGGLANTIIPGVLNSVHYKISVKSNWELADTRWNINGGNYHKSGEILELPIEGTFNISSMSTGSKLYTINVKRVFLNTWYTMEYSITRVFKDNSTDNVPMFTTKVHEIRVYVRGIKHYQVYDTVQNEVVTKTEPVQVRLAVGEFSGSMITPEGHELYLFNSRFGGINGAQKLVFQVVEHPLKQLSLELTAEKEYAWAWADPASQQKPASGPAEVVLCYRTNWGGEIKGLLRIRCREDLSRYFYDEDTMEVSEGTYHYYLEVNPDLEGDKLIRRAREIDITDTESHHTKFTTEVTRSKPVITTVQLTSNRVTPEVALFGFRLRVTISGDLNGQDPDYRLKIYKDGVDTGIIFNAPDWYAPFHDIHDLAVDPGIYRFVSMFDNSQYGELEIFKEVKPITTNNLYISAEITEDESGNRSWDTSMWQTSWENDDELESAIAKKQPVKFYLRLYLKGSLINGADIEVQDSNWNRLAVVQSGELITLTNSIPLTNTIHLVHSSSNTQATLTINTV